MHPVSPRLPRPFRTALLAAALGLVALLVLGACSSGSDSSDAGSGGASTGDALPSAEASAEAGAMDGIDAATMSEAGIADQAAEQAAQEPADPLPDRALINRGTVSLNSDDVADTAFDVLDVLDRHAGEVSEERTRTDEDGEVVATRMVLRVPAEHFEATFEALEQVGDLESSSASAEDVTTEVIDTEVRIRAQRRSLQRVEVLLDQARSIRDIVAIEAQLTRRQAELDSLEQRQAYLADQTSMSTITVTIERTEDDSKPEEEEAGFLDGLSAGWDALAATGTWVATVTGRVLPFAAVLLVLGVPLGLLVRRALRRRTPAPAPADA